LPSILGTLGGARERDTLRRKPHEYLAVDLLRGFAAFSVLVWHYQCLYAGTPGAPFLFHNRNEQPLYWLLRPFYEYGAAAVQLFWMISGFVFAAAYLSRRCTAKQFFVARLARLYPLHLATLLVVAGIQAFSRHAFGHVQIGGIDDLYHFGLNLFFASAWGLEKDFSYNNPIWSVSLEVVIYFIFFLSIPIVTRLRFVAPAALAVLFHQLHTRGVPGEFWQCGYFFFAGVFLFSVVERLGKAGLLLGAAMVAVWLFKSRALLDTTLWYALPLAFGGILVCAASIDKFSPTRPVTLKLAWIGESTYGTYLLHFPLMMVILCLFDATGVDRLALISRAKFFVLYVAALFGMARLCYLYFEAPADRAIRAYFLEPRKAPVAAAPSL
jgi:peptidoglycan/LPS O-acetylase OafA/YrhL